MGQSRRARTTFQLATSDWRADLAKWMERVRSHHVAFAIDQAEASDLDGLIGEVTLGPSVGNRIAGWIAPAVRYHEGRRAHRLAALDRQGEILADLERAAAELAQKQFPEPPVLAWQQNRTRCFAEFIDFAELGLPF